MEPAWIAQVKLVVEIIAVFGALATLGKGVIELVSQNRLKRFEKFLDMERRFEQTPEFQKLIPMVITNDPALKNCDLPERVALAGFFEEIALMHNSGLITIEVAFNMFGYYMIQCDKSDNFWHGLEKEAPYWEIFRKFAKQMHDFRRRLDENPDRELTYKF